MSDDYPKVTPKSIGRAVFRIGLKNTPSMAATFQVKVDSQGRITIPAEIRRKWHIEPGDVFFFLSKKNGFDLVLAEKSVKKTSAKKTKKA
ncbi:MAG: AbrB/MazE/SpoVT family DNA-binding domain-containing protein [Candidatus Riflebacteria bacterium]|nr:AbrB/MazE/SpoVT family DNA-binding domain-containing protein [Candidatus Riflebacteria bacterium]